MFSTFQARVETVLHTPRIRKQTEGWKPQALLSLPAATI